MKRFTILTMFFVGLALAAPVTAQPAAMTTPAPKPAAMTAQPNPMVVTPIKPMTAATPAATAPKPVAATMAAEPKPAAPVAAMDAPKPAAQPDAKPAAEQPKAKEPTPEWKTASFWISKVVLPILLFVLGLGWLKKSWLLWLKEKGIMVVADKVANGFEAYAKGTPAKWDDALAQALKAVVARFGELTPEQEAKVKAVVKERQEQAEKKNGDADGDA